MQKCCPHPCHHGPALLPGGNDPFSSGRQSGRGCQAGTPLHTGAVLPSAPAALPSLATLPPRTVLLREQGRLPWDEPSSSSSCCSRVPPCRAPPCRATLGLSGCRAHALSMVGAARSSTDFGFETVSAGPRAAWQERHASEIQLLL